MANMSYCRFTNTSTDLADCISAMEEAIDIPGLDMGLCEAHAYQYMVLQCRKFLAEHERLLAATTVDDLQKQQISLRA